MTCRQLLCEHVYVERRALLDKEAYRRNHNVHIDPCIAHLVLALNAAGLHTLQSCCGHGRGPGAILVLDNMGVGSLETFDLALHPSPRAPFPTP